MHLQEKPITVAIYAASLSGHNSSGTVRQQVTECWDFSNEKGWKVGHIYVDLGERKDLIHRTHFREMIQEAKMGRFDRIVLCNLIDLCSSSADLVLMEKVLANAGVPFHRVSNPSA
jgi:DNA invertase Pin-like site-specific DNA recombinase